MHYFAYEWRRTLLNYQRFALVVAQRQNSNDSIWWPFANKQESNTNETRTDTMQWVARRHWQKTNTTMMTSSNGNIILRYWLFVRGIHRSPVNSRHKGLWRGALIFSLMCVWLNGWVNNDEDRDLRRYRAHCNDEKLWCAMSNEFPIALFHRQWLLKRLIN